MYKSNNLRKIKRNSTPLFTLAIFTLCGCFLWCSVPVRASDGSSFNLLQVEQEQTETVIEESEDSGTDNENPDASEITKPEEQTKTENIYKEDFVFPPLSKIENGEITQNEIYNVLVAIHNLLLMGYLTALILFTYKLVTTAFRRFIYK